MAYYAKNPHDQPEPPRCPECDECMTEIDYPISKPEWQCRNPECESCPEKYRVIECSLCGEEFPVGEFCPHCVGEFLQ